MIEVQHLTRTRGRNPILCDVSFTLRNGTACGLLGVPDSGTSTLIQILAGVLAPTEGTVKVDGYDIVTAARRAKSRIGYVTENATAFPDMTPYEYLSFMAEARGAKDELAERQVKEALTLTDTLAVRDRLIGNLSDWERCRVAVAQALLGDPAPDTLLLDKPFKGLEPGQCATLRSLLASLQDRHTILLTAADPGEVAPLCDRLFLLRESQVVELDADIMARLHTHDLTLTVKGDEAGVRDALLAVPGVQSVEVTEVVNTAETVEILMTEGTAETACTEEAAEAGEVEDSEIEVTEAIETSPGTDIIRVSVTTDGDRRVRDALFFALAERHYVMVSCEAATVSLSELEALVESRLEPNDKEVTD